MRRVSRFECAVKYLPSCLALHSRYTINVSTNAWMRSHVTRRNRTQIPRSAGLLSYRVRELNPLSSFWFGSNAQISRDGVFSRGEPAENGSSMFDPSSRSSRRRLHVSRSAMRLGRDSKARIENLAQACGDAARWKPIRVSKSLYKSEKERKRKRERMGMRKCRHSRRSRTPSSIRRVKFSNACTFRERRTNGILRFYLSKWRAKSLCQRK